MTDQNEFIKEKGFATYSQSHLGDNRGQVYDDKLFAGRKHSAAVWQIEKYLLDAIIKDKPGGSYLDFACGTGRVAEHLETKFREPFGLDISPDMLKIAEERLRAAKIMERDILEQGVGDLENKFDVITAFRFFLNAEDELKGQAIKKIKQMLRPSGFLIFNIHQHSFSLDFLIENLKRAVAFKRRSIGNWMSHRQVNDLVSGASLTVKEIYSYAVLPRFLYRFLPFRVWFFIEKKLVSGKFLIGSHLIVVCQKS